MAVIGAKEEFGGLAGIFLIAGRDPELIQAGSGSPPGIRRAEPGRGMGLPLGKEQGHEAAPVAAVLPGSEVVLEILEGVVGKLRFDAPQAGSCEERFVCMLQQFQDLIQTRWRRTDK